MAAVPMLEEVAGGPSGAMIGQLAGFGDAQGARAQLELMGARQPARTLAIYPASAGFDLVEELDHLCNRSVEPNVFFNPRFLAPAMPRLEDREVRLAVIRDGDENRSRLRLLMPFSVEKPAVPLGVPIMRTWSSPFGPLGTPLVDRDDPLGVMEDFFAMLARPALKLPRVLALPEVRLDGPFASLLRSFAATAGLTLMTTGEVERPTLQSDLDGPTYLRIALRTHHFREFRRLKRRLAEHGELEYHVARQADEVRLGLEDFPVAGGGGLEGPRAHARWRSTATAPPSRARPCTAVRARHVPHPHADAGRPGHRLHRRLHRGRRRLHLEDRL